MTKVSVILPAAGSGRRFGAAENKIFQILDGEAIFMRTIKRFAKRPDVCQILLVMSADDMQRVSARWGPQLGELGVELVEGGSVRSESARNALAKVCDEAQLVCVHDAVRPCVTDEWIDAVFAKAATTNAAILACPLHGTIKHVDPAGIIDRTVDRDGLWEAQTPQVFEKELLRRAYQQDAQATDDAELVQQLGVQVSIVQADLRNVKITTPDDLAFAAVVLGSLECRPGEDTDIKGTPS